MRKIRGARKREEDKSRRKCRRRREHEDDGERSRESRTRGMTLGARGRLML